MSQAAERRRALGEFIRSRRERTTPEMVGMAPGLRRRTPGLRREEVALLSGIGVTWYTWLEQGRDINASAQVMNAVARVLQLNDVEQAHLFALAELPEPHLADQPPQVSPAIRVMLDQISPIPAVVAGPHWEILAGNDTYIAMVGDYRQLPVCMQNTLFLYFADPEWRHLMGDWEKNAPRLVAKMRAAAAADLTDPAWQRLLRQLEEYSTEFRELWERQEVAGMDNMVKHIHHREVGDIDTEVVHTWLTDRRGTRMTVYTPLNAASRSAYERLATVAPRIIPDPRTFAPAAVGAMAAA
ncbi:helix-turn-helix transcriptional regulator [Hamadaea tsunoensis]|uniref:helix-turn-helix transcriptional regulator n=1 Tax=Hamadaea tsunoensis TaxID=53368 RepID=UPI0003F7352E|nr:helix-turn-helix transcriptional regulator [Hamadaea tsunoensis]